MQKKRSAEAGKKKRKEPSIRSKVTDWQAFMQGRYLSKLPDAPYNQRDMQEWHDFIQESELDEDSNDFSGSSISDEINSRYSAEQNTLTMLKSVEAGKKTDKINSSYSAEQSTLAVLQSSPSDKSDDESSGFQSKKKARRIFRNTPLIVDCRHLRIDSVSDEIDSSQSDEAGKKKRKEPSIRLEEIEDSDSSDNISICMEQGLFKGFLEYESDKDSGDFSGEENQYLSSSSTSDEINYSYAAEQNTLTILRSSPSDEPDEESELDESSENSSCEEDRFTSDEIDSSHSDFIAESELDEDSDDFSSSSISDEIDSSHSVVRIMKLSIDYERSDEECNDIQSQTKNDEAFVHVSNLSVADSECTSEENDVENDGSLNQADRSWNIPSEDDEYHSVTTDLHRGLCAATGEQCVRGSRSPHHSMTLAIGGKAKRSSSLHHNQFSVVKKQQPEKISVEEFKTNATSDVERRDSSQMKDDKAIFIPQLLGIFEPQTPPGAQPKKKSISEESKNETINTHSLRRRIEESYGILEGNLLTPVLAALIRTQIMIGDLHSTIMIELEADTNVIPQGFMQEFIGKVKKNQIQNRFHSSYGQLRGIFYGIPKVHQEWTLCAETGSMVAAIPFAVEVTFQVPEEFGKHWKQNLMIPDEAISVKRDISFRYNEKLDAMLQDTDVSRRSSAGKADAILMLNLKVEKFQKKKIIPWQVTRVRLKINGERNRRTHSSTIENASSDLLEGFPILCEIQIEEETEVQTVSETDSRRYLNNSRRDTDSWKYYSIVGTAVLDKNIFKIVPQWCKPKNKESRVMVGANFSQVFRSFVDRVPVEEFTELSEAADLLLVFGSILSGQSRRGQRIHPRETKTKLKRSICTEEATQNNESFVIPFNSSNCRLRESSSNIFCQNWPMIGSQTQAVQFGIGCLGIVCRAVTTSRQGNNSVPASTVQLGSGSLIDFLSQTEDSIDEETGKHTMKQSKSCRSSGTKLKKKEQSYTISQQSKNECQCQTVTKISERWNDIPSSSKFTVLASGKKDKERNPSASQSESLSLVQLRSGQDFGIKKGLIGKELPKNQSRIQENHTLSQVGLVTSEKDRGESRQTKCIATGHKESDILIGLETLLGLSKTEMGVQLSWEEENGKFQFQDESYMPGALITPEAIYDAKHSVSPRRIKTILSTSVGTFLGFRAFPKSGCVLCEDFGRESESFGKTLGIKHEDTLRRKLTGRTLLSEAEAELEKRKFYIPDILICPSKNNGEFAVDMRTRHGKYQWIHPQTLGTVPVCSEVVAEKAAQFLAEYLAGDLRIIVEERGLNCFVPTVQNDDSNLEARKQRLRERSQIARPKTTRMRKKLEAARVSHSSQFPSSSKETESYVAQDSFRFIRVQEAEGKRRNESVTQLYWSDRLVVVGMSRMSMVYAIHKLVKSINLAIQSSSFFSCQFSMSRLQTKMNTQEDRVMFWNNVWVGSANKFQAVVDISRESLNPTLHHDDSNKEQHGINSRTEKATVLKVEESFFWQSELFALEFALPPSLSLQQCVISELYGNLYMEYMLQRSLTHKLPILPMPLIIPVDFLENSQPLIRTVKMRNESANDVPDHSRTLITDSSTDVSKCSLMADVSESSISMLVSQCPKFTPRMDERFFKLEEMEPQSLFDQDESRILSGSEVDTWYMRGNYSNSIDEQQNNPVECSEWIRRHLLMSLISWNTDTYV
ncbi:MAG: hypothetical protein GY795_00550 [Desulfobacterales bacterium]|nr:hypothetical protein [Desulfobacterales bacterium]